MIEISESTRRMVMIEISESTMTMVMIEISKSTRTMVMIEISESIRTMEMIDISDGLRYKMKKKTYHTVAIISKHRRNRIKMATHKTNINNCWLG